jgi:hypothetical protein
LKEIRRALNNSLFHEQINDSNLHSTFLSILQYFDGSKSYGDFDNFKLDEAISHFSKSTFDIILKISTLLHEKKSEAHQEFQKLHI